MILIGHKYTCTAFVQLLPFTPPVPSCNDSRCPAVNTKPSLHPDEVACFKYFMSPPPPPQTELCIYNQKWDRASGDCGGESVEQLPERVHTSFKHESKSGFLVDSLANHITGWMEVHILEEWLTKDCVLHQSRSSQRKQQCDNNAALQPRNRKEIPNILYVSYVWFVSM